MPTIQQVIDYLVEQARANKPVTYSQLCHHFGIPAPQGDFANHPLRDIFDTIDQEDARQNRPFLTTLVYAANLNMPGQGYFGAQANYAGKNVPNNNEGKLKFWAEELAALDRYWHK